MHTTIDRLRRVVLPKAIRDRLKLRGGETLEVEERDGVVELRPLPGEMRVAETSEGPVAEAVDDVPVLTDELLRDTRDRLRP